jgi:hypothetical protein
MKTLDCQVVVPTKTGDVTLTLVIAESDGSIVVLDIHPFARERLFSSTFELDYFTPALGHLRDEVTRKLQAANQAALQPPADAGA